MTFSFKAPESVANHVRRVANLLVLMGEATNFLEALQGMAIEVEQSRQPTLDAWRAASSKDHWRWAVYMAQNEQGGRCLICGTSKMIDPHHGIPRSAGGSDEKDNLYLLCRRCHDKITFATDGAWHWRTILLKLAKFRIDAMRAMNNQGWVSRRDRTAEVERVVHATPSSSSTTETQRWGL